MSTTHWECQPDLAPLGRGGITTTSQHFEVEAPENITYIPKGMSGEELVTGTKYARDRFHAERRTDLPYWLGIDKTEY